MVKRKLSPVFSFREYILTERVCGTNLEACTTAAPPMASSGTPGLPRRPHLTLSVFMSVKGSRVTAQSR